MMHDRERAERRVELQKMSVRQLREILAQVRAGTSRRSRVWCLMVAKKDFVDVIMAAEELESKVANKAYSRL